MALIKCSEFWEEELLYQPAFEINAEGLIDLRLRCQIWSLNKIKTLLESPLKLRSHDSTLPSIAYLKEIVITAKFYGELGVKLDATSMVPQLQEYMSSLIISQLEFQFPLVFSAVARKRFQGQEAVLAAVSYSSTESSFLIPLLVRLIANDPTATTAYQLLSHYGYNVTFRIIDIMEHD